VTSDTSCPSRPAVGRGSIEEALREALAQLSVTGGGPSRLVGIGEPGDDPVQLEQREAGRPRSAVDEPLEPRPAREAVLAGDRQLGLVKCRELRPSAAAWPPASESGGSVDRAKSVSAWARLTFDQSWAQAWRPRRVSLEPPGTLWIHETISGIRAGSRRAAFAYSAGVGTPGPSMNRWSARGNRSSVTSGRSLRPLSQRSRSPATVT
jgi:hypothetical protein